MASDCGDADELVLTATLAALALSKGKNSDELNLIGNFLSTVGALVLLVQAVVGCQEARQSEQETAARLDELEGQVKKLKACGASKE
ncbi:MAG: hypothetical protein RIN56_08495 [Sporomusaceae bacterium]|nr:hypothetical protein [Sporomusaceae bacterium]